MLTVRQHVTLNLATRRYKYPGHRDAAIRDELGVSPVRFAMMVGVLLEDGDAETERPVEVRRLRRVRDRQREARVSA